MLLIHLCVPCPIVSQPGDCTPSPDDRGTPLPATQNVFMYLDSIVCNVGVMILKGDLSTVFDVSSADTLMQFFVVAIILNNAVVGIVTSLFLKVRENVK